MGDLNKNAVKLEGPMKKLTINGKSFRESIMAGTGEEPWLSSEILVNTLATLDGRFSKAALSAELTKNGLKKYTSAQVEAKIADCKGRSREEERCKVYRRPVQSVDEAVGFRVQVGNRGQDAWSGLRRGEGDYWLRLVGFVPEHIRQPHGSQEDCSLE